MNYSSWMTKIMKSDLPQNMLKTIGVKRKRRRSMTYSLMGVAASAAAAYLFKNRTDVMKQFNQASHLHQPYHRPSASLTEFAKEITSGITHNRKNVSVNTQSSGFHAASSTDPESSQMISQIASAVQHTGNGQEMDQLASKLIQTNVKKQ